MTPTRYEHIAFGPAAVERQKAKGRRVFDAGADDGPMSLDTREKAMIRDADQFHIGTVTESGWPYVQYRSGPAGFLHVLGDSTVAFADFRGNNQYVTTANIDHDGRVTIFLVNYPLRQRLKLYGRAVVVEADSDPALLERLKNLGDRTVAATCERSIVIEIEAFDWNCTRSIIPRYDKDYVERLSALYQRDAAARETELLGRIAELEAKLAERS